MTSTDAHRAIDAVWRIESAKVIAGLARIVGDIGQAEDLAQDALLIALEKWPETGVPDNPGAWLMATAKHRAFDVIRRKALHERKEAELTYEIENQLAAATPDVEAMVEAAFDEVRQLDSMLSNYKPDSEWSEVNRAAASHLGGQVASLDEAGSDLAAAVCFWGRGLASAAGLATAATCSGAVGQRSKSCLPLRLQ